MALARCERALHQKSADPLRRAGRYRSAAKAILIVDQDYDHLLAQVGLSE
jgi:hypothetical protein